MTQPDPCVEPAIPNAGYRYPDECVGHAAAAMSPDPRPVMSGGRRHPRFGEPPPVNTSPVLPPSVRNGMIAACLLWLRQPILVPIFVVGSVLSAGVPRRAGTATCCPLAALDRWSGGGGPLGVSVPQSLRV